MKNVGNSSDGRSQGGPKISGHPCIGRLGALRGHLCDSTAFLFLILLTLNCLVLASTIMLVQHSFFHRFMSMFCGIMFLQLYARLILWCLFVKIGDFSYIFSFRFFRLGTKTMHLYTCIFPAVLCSYSHVLQ